MIYKHKTNIPGLKYRPSFNATHPTESFIPTAINKDLLDSFVEYDNYIQSIDSSQINMYHGPIDFTEANQRVLKIFLQKTRKATDPSDRVKILEIGVARGKPSSTEIFLNESGLGFANPSLYYGVDLRDVSELVKSNNRCEAKTLVSDSFKQEKIRTFIGKEPLDILMIDGDHSINTVLNDWLYHDLVKTNGYIIMHDTNHHPGPREVFDAIDETYFIKRRYCLEDYGISVIQKLI